MPRLEQVLKSIDDANMADPRMTSIGGQDQPYELVYGHRMSEMLSRFHPDAGELVQVAVRGQHIERWRLPRDDYPRNKVGYHQWRNEQKQQHALRTTELMQKTGYSEDDCTHVSNILQKKGIKRDADTQLVEDVACLVFLEFYAADFAKDHDDEKVISIIRKTLPKMSAAGHTFAGSLTLDARIARLLTEAVTQYSSDISNQ